MRVLSIISLFAFFVFVIAQVQAQCPHQRSGLTRWSSQSSWNQPNAAVVIDSTQSVLLDVSTPTIKSINIFGELIFDNSIINLNVGFIRVEQGGKLTMGSSTCRLTSKIIVTFFGDRNATSSDLGLNPSDNAILGSKGLAAVTGSYVEIWGADLNGVTWTRLAQTAAANANQITLEKSVIWKAGDTIALASTDYSPLVAWQASYPDSINWRLGKAFPEQSEDVVISSVSADGKTLVLASPLKYPHFVSSDNTDVRGEVGLLSRNIVFQGDASTNTTYFGGHLMIRDVARAWINGVEFRSMAQRGVMGRYPVHFHVMGDPSVDGRAYLKDSSVHHNFQRCVTVHDTRGVLIKNNVAYWNNGHCFFMEDGCETNNVFDSNLGIAIKPVEQGPNRLVPTDSQPSMYWITNPSNDFTNNVGVGGFHTFWYSLPEKPVGISKAKYANVLQMQPRLMSPGLFNGNVAHGAAQNGLHIDDFQLPDETADHTTAYTPVVGPFVAGQQIWQYTGLRAIFENLVLYKNRNFGTWTRGSSFHFRNIRTYDNQVGILSVPGTNYIENSIIVGDSDNLGIPRDASDNGRSRPNQWDVDVAMIKGIDGYDNGGQQLFRNNTFKNFVSTPSRRAGALGVLTDGRFLLHARNRVSQSTFINSNPVWFQQTTTSDNNNNAQILDLDGTTTQLRGGAWIVTNNSIVVDPECDYKPEWNGYRCPPNRNGFVQIILQNDNLSGTSFVDPTGADRRAAVGTVNVYNQRMTFYKIKTPSNPTVKSWSGVGSNYGPNSMSYYLNAQPNNVYAVRFAYNTPTPTVFSATLQGAAPGDWIIVAIPYPTTAQPFTITLGDAAVTPVSSLSTLFTPSSFNTYYYDASSQHLYLRMDMTDYSVTKTFFNGYGYSDYNAYYSTFSITASCSTCSITQNLNLPTFTSAINMGDEYYKATLQSCQQDVSLRTNPTLTDQKGLGTAFLTFNPIAKTFKINLYHDLNERVTSIYLKSSSGRILSISLSPYSPVRAMVTASYQDWLDLSQGQLYFYVTTTKNPNGELVGRIGCETSGACSVPTPIGGQLPCSSSINALTIYNKGPMKPYPAWQASVWNDASNVYNSTVDPINTEQTLCGNGDTSIKVSLWKGGFQLGKYDNTFSINSTYTYFEFYIRTAPGMGRVRFDLSFGTPNGVRYSFDTTDSSTVNTFVVDENNWSRVMIPVSRFQFPSTNQIISTLSLSIPWWRNSDWNKPIFFYIDNVRFVAPYTDTMTSTVSSSSIYNFGAICNDVIVGADTDTSVVSTPTPTPSVTKINGSDLTGGTPVPAPSSANRSMLNGYWLITVLFVTMFVL